MNNNNKNLVDWIVKKVETEYKDDVSILVVYGSYINGNATEFSDVDLYYVPKTDKAHELRKTFIINGIGYDIFSMSWERVEGIADFNENLIPCVGNSQVLFCSSENEMLRFKQLQNRITEHLNDFNFMITKAEEKIDTAKNLYLEMMFKSNICDVKTISGYILLEIADAIAYANQTYFKNGLKNQYDDLKNRLNLPCDFLKDYDVIVKSHDITELKTSCQKVIENTLEFIRSEKQVINKAPSKNYEELAEIYQEIISTWNKIYSGVSINNYFYAFVSGVCLQRELNSISNQFGTETFDLMGYFSENLNEFKAKAEAIQNQIIKIITDNGIDIEQYKNVDEFISKN